MCFIFTFGEHTFRKEVEGYQGIVCRCYNCGNYSGHVIKSHPWFTFCFVVSWTDGGAQRELCLVLVLASVVPLPPFPPSPLPFPFGFLSRLPRPYLVLHTGETESIAKRET
jgi:hypothetical protein